MILVHRPSTIARSTGAFMNIYEHCSVLNSTCLAPPMLVSRPENDLHFIQSPTSGLVYLHIHVFGRDCSTPWDVLLGLLL